jgi:hypothetical protein
MPDMPTWKPYQTVRPTREQMQTFGFAHRSGFGMIAGPVSGRGGAWDFDCLNTHTAFVAAAEASGLGDVVRRIEAGYCDETPGGGRRWIVTYPETVEWRDQTHFGQFRRHRRLENSNFLGISRVRPSADAICSVTDCLG